MRTTNGFQPTGGAGLEGLSREQLIERLLVAETIMKKLYSRNKELEIFHEKHLDKENNDSTFVSQPEIDNSEAIQKILAEMKQNEVRMERELENKNDTITSLRN